MYILSMKLINTKEDVFHRDIGDVQEMNKLMQDLLIKNKKYFFKHKLEVTRERDEEDNYVLHTKLGIFKTVTYARDFFVEITDSAELIRGEARAWNQQNKILTKVEVINIIDNSSVRQLLNCLTNTCERFGGKCDETNGCSTVLFAKEYANSRKPFPIKVVVG